MKFTKMHGLGNNYIYVNLFEERLEEKDLPSLAVRVSDINTGIGSDGMILICPSERADFRMRVFNNDGSEAKNCGNGLRCVSKYVFDRGLTAKTSFSVETLGGIVAVDVHLDDMRRVSTVTVDMGAPRLLKSEIPMVGAAHSMTVNEPVAVEGVSGPNGEQWRMTVVSMGNPHTVMFVPDVANVPLTEIGPKIEFAPVFPERINVEFIAVKNRREIDFRVWERGSGITQACGTGACAAVVAGVLNGQLDRGESVTVHLPGGDLDIVYSEEGRVFMTGPAAFICDGTYYA
jgi:diaminopimelate epimerase